MKKIFITIMAVVASLSAYAQYIQLPNFNIEYKESDVDRIEIVPASPLANSIEYLYSIMNMYAGDPLQTPWMANNLMSDDCNGAGGTGDVESHAIGHLMSNKDNLFERAWEATYMGIARANYVINNFNSIKGFDNDETTRKHMLGEAYFMRGLFYLWGTQFWGDIPAYWTATNDDMNLTQSSAENVIYPHILADFLSAISLMNHNATIPGDGRATKGAAEGYLARAYMFYEGFYKRAGELAKATPEAVELPSQDGVSGSLTKDIVIGYLEDAILNGGYKLVSDFRLLWQYTNKYSVGEYPYTADLAAAGLSWAGNNNSEEIFQVQFSNDASWNGNVSMGWTNMTSLYCGLRCDDNGWGETNGTAKSIPFGQGWGQGTINANLWDDWSDNDPRKKATILDGPAEFGDGFVFTTSCSEDAGYYNKKLLPVTCSKSTFNDIIDAYTWWGVQRKETTGERNNNGNSFQGDHFNDIYLMRLSDIYLMHTELTGDATYMNKVRERAGLRDLPYSWSNVKNERRWEFAGEGLRYNDLRRWSGKEGNANCTAARALEKQNGTRVYYCGRLTTMHHAVSSWAQRYAETDGFLQIPPKEILLNPNIKQNRGWGSDVSDWEMTGTPVY